MANNLTNLIDKQRIAFGLVSIIEAMQTIGATNTLLDPFSLLVSRTVKIGAGNTFYPNVSIIALEEGVIEIGDRNTFFPGCYFLANPGSILVGSENEFGDGGFAAKANMPGSRIEIGNTGRYTGGPQVLGHTKLGSGSQVIGPVTVQDCVLHDGESYRGQNPDQRAALLKGSGLARGIVLGRGEVIQGQGNFDQAQVMRQAAFHQRPKA